jgi:Leucine-rich repeat (LRR) protein
MLQQPDSVRSINLRNKNEIYIDSVCHSLHLFKNLKAIQIVNSDLVSIPHEIGNASGLEYINIGFCKLRQHIEILYTLTNLKHLNLSNNSITEIPKGISKLKKIESIDFNNNTINRLPNDFHHLNSLLAFGINYNPIYIISFPKNIIHIEMVGCGITDMAWIVNNKSIQKKLQGLHLGNNNLTIIPSTIDKLIIFEYLNLNTIKLPKSNALLDR